MKVHVCHRSTRGLYGSRVDAFLAPLLSLVIHTTKDTAHPRASRTTRATSRGAR
jgi:hypothetical protein